MRKTLMMLVMLPMVVCAQQDEHKDFQAFRKEVLGNYASYRDDILRNYAKYLDGIWKEYDAFRGIHRDNKPKPTVVPAIQPTKVPSELVVTEPLRPIIPNSPNVNSTIEPIAKPIIPNPNINTPTVDVNFYGHSIKIKTLDVNLANTTTFNFGTVWKILINSKRASEIVTDIRGIKQDMGLNDWFTFELTKVYAEKAVNIKNDAAVALLTQFIASQIGLDVRLARSKDVPLLLIAFEQTVYERAYIKNDNEKLYVYPVDDKVSYGRIETCKLPKEAKLGRSVNLVINESPRISGQRHPFSIIYGGVTLKGSINLTLMDMVKHYPQMPIPEYAKSCLDIELRRSLCTQLQQQLGNMSESVAINRLLLFVQHGFEYATDQQQHGYEKPYFVEEMFYYPRCDCEDRAIFFAYLVKYALGIDNVLISYPGHECTAIRSSAITGDGFIYDSNRYSIADPTYIGASAGRCMPDFRNVQPQIERWY